MTTKKLLAFKMRLYGYTYLQIAQKTGLSEHTLRHYFSRKGKWYQEYQEWSGKEIEGVQEALHTSFLAHSTDAFWNLVELSHCNKPSIVLRASQDILDRAGFAKHSRGFETNDPTDHAEELMQMLEKQKR